MTIVGKNITNMTEDNIKVTFHAYNRIKERMGLGKKAANRISRKAYSDGLVCNEMKNGQLKRYISEKEDRYNSQDCMRIYGQEVYCFAKDLDPNGIQQIRLITVYPVPKGLQNHAIGQQKNRRVI